jgi:hypothetical protein
VERELVLRLASLLWRLRRATSIETDLLRIQAEILRDRRERQSLGQPEWGVRFRVLEPAIPLRNDDWNDNNPEQADELCNRADHTHPVSTSRELGPQQWLQRDHPP